ncbi:hypothetical protein [Devosia aurantiaca]|uniref:Uncharacterized protein n=1 Tax=Devosia aurantiaca TaxID=2714858 RepID=A0A6M1SBU8_9HYPH|nr:hypothetical protein [Devosia aurantiaca]NGP17389.1 hypothetical protein [Devosia aurantiaca]
MLARLSLVALTAFAALATPAFAKTKPAAQPEQVTCEGVFGPDSSEKLVKETFGAENVVTGMVPGPEGTEMLATTVFGDDPDRKMEFGWFDEENFARLSYVELSPSQTAPGGVRIGMTPAEVEKLNGTPFIIGGFWWDYGGYAQIENGKLANADDATCYLSLRFSPADEYSPAIDVTPVSGEVQVPSDEGLLEILDTRLEVLSLGYAWPDDLPQPEY